jgi:putative ABC transport system permease protein
VRGLRWSRVWENTFQDLRFGLRILLKTPITTALMLLIFALGIGATTAFFSIVNVVLLRPLPYPHPEQILRVQSTWRGRPGGVSAGNWHDWREQTATMTNIAAILPFAFNVGLGEAPQRLAGAKVTSDYFQVFNTAPVAGRVFTTDEDQPGKDDVVVISDSFWRDQFGRKADAIGSTISIDRRPFHIIGVMPPHYDPIGNADQFWIPLALTPAQLKDHDDHMFITIGRLKPGVSMAQAQSEMNIIAKRLEQEYPKDDSERGITLEPLKDDLVRDFKPSLLLMLGATVFLLLIACANIANLQLARSAARQKEIAMRAALGASPARIVRQLLAESVGLALIGGGLGIAVAWGATRWLIERLPGGPSQLSQAGLDATTLIFSLLITIGCGLVCGLVPAVRSRSLFLANTLKDSGGATAGRSTRDRVRTMIVVTQTALTLMLLTGAALLLKSAEKLNHTNPGFDAHNVIAGRIPLAGGEYQDAQKIRQTFLAIADEVRQIPGVQSVSLDSRVPLGGGNDNGLIPEGRPLDVSSAIASRFQMVTPELFATLRIPLKEGRTFTALDRAGSTRVMIINQTLAKQAFPGESAIGKRIACCEMNADGTPTWKEVVGVVGDVRSMGLDQDVMPEFYLPVEQAPDAAWQWVRQSMDLVVRGTNDPMPLTNDIRHIVARVAPGTPFSNVSTMEQRISQSVEQNQFTTMLLTSFSVVALLLASIGIYGVLSYSVTQRSREIGIRMAIGAQRRDVLKMIVAHGMKLTAIGVTLGLIGALCTTRMMSSLLFQVTPTDPAVLAAVVVLVAGIALFASYLPARRASGVDPLVAFRAE